MLFCMLCSPDRSEESSRVCGVGGTLLLLPPTHTVRAPPLKVQPAMLPSTALADALLAELSPTAPSPAVSEPDVQREDHAFACPRGGGATSPILSIQLR